MKGTVVRTIRLPIAEVLGDSTKQQFYSELRDVLRRCTAAFNRCLTECVVLDRDALEAVGRGEKVPKAPKLYTYPIINHNFPGLANVASSIARAAEAKYRQERFDILIQRRSLPTQRSCPLPVLHNKSNKMMRLELDNDGNVITSLKLLGTERYTLRIKGGSNYRRQLRTVKTAIESGGISDSKIWIDRRGVAVFGIACKIPTKTDRTRRGVLKVQTAREAFIVATKEATDVPFTINADHVKRWQAERQRKQQRLRQDRKSGTSRKQLAKQQDIASRKHRNRVSSFIEESTAHIIQHACRRRIATIEFNNTIRSWMPQFPWFEFKTRLQNKCDDHGIEFVESTSEVTPADLGEAVPHVYCDVGVDRITGELRNVKIGKSVRKVGERAKDDSRAQDQDWVTLWTHKTTKSGLAKLEKHYLSMFAEHRINGAKEMFQRDPIIKWSREVDCLGNAGNLSQIQQHMEA